MLRDKKRRKKTDLIPPYTVYSAIDWRFAQADGPQANRTGRIERRALFIGSLIKNRSSAVHRGISSQQTSA